MLIMIMSDAPLPMPNVVIWSAIHMTKSDAVVMPITVISWKPRPGFTTSCTLPNAGESNCGCMRGMAMPQDCATQSTIVR